MGCYSAFGLIILYLSYFQGALGLEVFLDASGRDSNDGRSYNTPFRTFSRLQSFLKESTPQDGVIIVNVASGDYRLTQPIILDSHQPYPFRLHLRGNGTVNILGSIALNETWKSDGSIYV